MIDPTMLNFLANIFQLADYEMNVQQTSNDELMKHLRLQDSILYDQTHIYLKKIVEQNEEILRLLKKGG